MVVTGYWCFIWRGERVQVFHPTHFDHHSIDKYRDQVYVNRTTPYQVYVNRTTPYQVYVNRTTPYQVYVNRTTPYGSTTSWDKTKRIWKLCFIFQHYSLSSPLFILCQSSQASGTSSDLSSATTTTYRVTTPRHRGHLPVPLMSRSAQMQQM